VSTRSTRFAYVLLLVTPALSCSNMLAARWIAGEVPPVALAFWRWTLTLILLLPFVARDLFRHRGAVRREWRGLLALGALGMGICGAPVYIAAQTTTATNIGLIFAVSPIVVTLLARLLWGELLTLPRIAGIVLCLTGVLAVVLRGDPSALVRLAFTAGDLWALFAMLGWALYSILLKQNRSVLPVTPRLAAITFGGDLVMLPFLAAETALVGPPPLTPRALGAIVFVALVPGLCSYLAYSRLVAQLGPSRTSLQLYLMPLYTALLAWLLLGEQLRLYHLVGGAMILPGLFLATRPTAPAPAAAAAPARAGTPSPLSGNRGSG
jgi:drug/metabolite transporter (DMT)-like permease